MKLTHLHDWEIRRIEVDRELKSASLYLYYPVNDKNVVMTFNGVKRFFASGMILQNVILDVLVFESDLKSDYLDYCKKLLNIDSVQLGIDSMIIFIEPSVGAEVVCYCKSVDVIEIEKKD